MSETSVNKALHQFAELLIKKIEEVNDDPKQSWFSLTGRGLPQNIEGRVYNGVNHFMLFLQCELNKYQTPTFMTFPQAKAKNIHIKKGESAFPVIYWGAIVKDNNKNYITLDEYNSLPEEEQKNYTVNYYKNIYGVFNVDQTNFAEVYPEKWEELKQKFSIPALKDEKEMFACSELDQLLQNNKWLCPITLAATYNARYFPNNDQIEMPLKSQFYTGELFYNTLLHEMTHSTGHESRLGRDIKNNFMTPKYAKEELVAELTSAVCCRSLGIISGIQEENAKYLKNWLGAIKEEPQFLFSILSDIGKASTLILNEVNKIELGMDIVPKNITEEREPSKSEKENSFTAAIEAAQIGNYQPFMDLQVQGIFPSEREIKLMQNNLDHQTLISVGLIFSMQIVPQLSIQVPSIEKNKTVTQLSLNF